MAGKLFLTEAPAECKEVGLTKLLVWLTFSATDSLQLSAKFPLWPFVASGWSIASPQFQVVSTIMFSACSLSPFRLIPSFPTSCLSSASQSSSLLLDHHRVCVSQGKTHKFCYVKSFCLNCLTGVCLTSSVAFRVVTMIRPWYVQHTVKWLKWLKANKKWRYALVLMNTFQQFVHQNSAELIRGLLHCSSEVAICLNSIDVEACTWWCLGCLPGAMKRGRSQIWCIKMS